VLHISFPSGAPAPERTRARAGVSADPTNPAENISSGQANGGAARKERRIVNLAFIRKVNHEPVRLVALNVSADDALVVADNANVAFR